MAGAQQFGGPWSVLKVETVEKYLKAFTTALKDKPTATKPFKRIYIDAFAGNGYFTYGSDLHGFFADQSEARRMHEGSAVRAINVSPSFDEILLIDDNPSNAAALRSICETNSRVLVEQRDANSAVKDRCAALGKDTRGVIFLDPFGNSVEWGTLEAIAHTQVLDLWYLFPLAGAFRNLPHDHAKLTPDKRATLTRIFGASDWEAEFYKEADTTPLFGIAQPIRRAEQDQIERYVKRRLSSIFAHVESPRRLFTDRGAPLFSLFFAVSNPSEAAIKAASNIAKSLLRPSAKGTRHK